MKTILIILIAIISLSSTCRKDKRCGDGTHYAIEIINNSNKTINWKTFSTDSIYHINGTPANNIIEPHSSYSYNDRECWETHFGSYRYVKYMLIFDSDTVQTIGWDAINGTNRGLLKNVKVDINYLEEHDYEITYP